MTKRQHELKMSLAKLGLVPYSLYSAERAIRSARADVLLAVPERLDLVRDLELLERRVRTERVKQTRRRQRV